MFKYMSIAANAGLSMWSVGPLHCVATQMQRQVANLHSISAGEHHEEDKVVHLGYGAKLPPPVSTGDERRLSPSYSTTWRYCGVGVHLQCRESLGAAQASQNVELCQFDSSTEPLNWRTPRKMKRRKGA